MIQIVFIKYDSRIKDNIGALTLLVAYSILIH
jgi:hypothetical protein